MNVDILISTYGKGINNVAQILLEEQNNVRYVISHQCDSLFVSQIPRELVRRDVIVSRIQGKGLSKSRNNALSQSSAFVGLISDDDVKYKQSYFDTIVKYHQSYPNYDVIIFKIRTLEGEPEYKDYQLEIKEEKYIPRASSIEISFKLKKINGFKIRFDERFGAGKKFLIGSEERIFLHDCLKAGLKILYVPEYIVEHPYESTAKTLSKYDNRRIRVIGGFDARINGPIAIPKSLFGTIKIMPDLIKHNKNPIIYFWERFRAAVYITFTKSTK
jgi:uncharacterized membrane protein